MNKVPSYALYGVPATRDARPAGSNATSRIAAPSGPYLGRGPKCVGNDDTCNANKVKDSDYCAGHLRSMNKATKVEAPKEDA